jgi:hypothetical protein
VQYPFVARSVLAVHKITSRLRDEKRRSPFLGAHGSYRRYLDSVRITPHEPEAVHPCNYRGPAAGRFAAVAHARLAARCYYATCWLAENSSAMHD